MVELLGCYRHFIVNLVKMRRAKRCQRNEMYSIVALNVIGIRYRIVCIRVLSSVQVKGRMKPRRRYTAMKLIMMKMMVMVMGMRMRL